MYQPFFPPSLLRLSSSNDTPVEFGNYPNPFVKSTTLEFYLTDETEATIECFDSDGRLIKTLSKNSYFTSGNHKINWDGTNDSGIQINQGVYISRITLNDGKILSRKIIKE